MPKTRQPSPNAEHPARRCRVALDLVPIRVGEGGTGSGIWTYARELLHAMDRQLSAGLELLCFVNAGQLPYLADLQNIRLVRFAGGTKKGILSRLAWMHLRLPIACRKHRVNVIHKLATDNPWFCPARRVTTVHDFYYEYLMEQQPRESIRLYERLENRYFSWVSRICFKKSAAIIAVSLATRDEAVKRYPTAADRITVIHHGAPVDGERRTEGSGQATDAPNSKPDVFRILCVAKFMEHKGQHLLIEAFEQLLVRHPELAGRVTLRLRGFHNDAEYYARICRAVEDSRYSDLIKLEPFNAADSLEAIYCGADLVALLSSYEGFGLPVLEAQAMGIPVLCSDIPVLREVGGFGAVYVNRTDTQQVAEALRRFASDENWCLMQRDKARANVGRFSWDQAAQSTLETYANCQVLGTD